jgi:hypothetical protein
MESLIPFSRLLNVQAHPAAGRARRLFSQISDFNFIFAQNYMLGAISCQIQINRAAVGRNEDRWEPARSHWAILRRGDKRGAEQSSKARENFFLV